MAESSLDRACRRVRNNDHTLLELDLSSNEISDEGATALQQALKGNTTLQRLNLSSNEISDEGATALQQALKGNTTLQRLNLSSNEISDEGATALAQVVKGNTTLKMLDLARNQIGDEGATALAQAMKGYRSTTLRTLDLSSNEISDVGATALALAMKGNTTLQFLGLSHNLIGDEGATALAHAMKGNTTLELLDLNNNQISDEGATALAQAMKGNTILPVLYLADNQISDEGVTALGSLLHGNTKLVIYTCGRWIEPSDKPKDTAAHDGEIAPFYDNKPKDTAACGEWIEPSDEWIEPSDEWIEPSDEWIEPSGKPTHDGEIAPFYDHKPKDTAACVRWIEPSDKPKDTAAHDGEIAPFYDNLIKLDGLDVNAATRLLFELSSFIDDVHQMKIYYTYVACYRRMGLIEKEDAATFIRNGLRYVSTECRDQYSVVIFKVINEKAKDDGYLTPYDFHYGVQLAERAGLQPMSESLAAAIQANTARIEGLEANLEAVNNSVNQMRMALRSRYQIKAATGFISAVINAVSMGVGGGLVNAATAFDSVIDFGDINHLEVIFANNAAVLAKVHEGLDRAKDIVEEAGQYMSDSKLKDVVFNEEDVVVGLVVAAALVRPPMVKQPNSGDNLAISPTHPPAIAVGTGEATSSAVEVDDMFSACCHRLRSNDSTLQELYLHKKIGDEGVAALAGALVGNITLQMLSLDFNQIGDDGVVALARSLKVNTALQVLSLDLNQIGDDGVVALGRMFNGNTKLEKLNLVCNKIGDTGVGALARSLKVNTTLQMLNLDNNLIGDEGMAVLARSLEVNTTLQMLNLARNQIGDKGVTVLACSLEINTTLQMLNLARNQIGDVGVTALARSLEGNATLQRLNLFENEIGDGVAALASLLHGNRILSIYGIEDQEGVNGTENNAGCVCAMLSGLVKKITSRNN